MITDEFLTAFIDESNMIEGIMEYDVERELQAYRSFLSVPWDMLSIVDLEILVTVIQPDARLRVAAGQDVIIGRHFPPRGGPEIVELLDKLLEDVKDSHDPWLIHQRYEHLHPFTDGNGRSGRALWLYHMDQGNRLCRGFLHQWYYDSLERWRKDG
jgi:hypothetical protein